jgi:tetratricopeptide (TPR) repeat protein
MGEPVVREIFANNSNEAQAALLAEGFTDLKLIEEDVVAAASEEMPRSFQVMGQPVSVTTEERIKHYNKPPRGFFGALRDGVGQSAGGVVFITLLAAFQFYRGNRTGGLLALLALAAWLVFIVFVSMPSIYYRKLHRAADWYRWPEVLDLVATLQSMRKFHFVKLPLAELGRYRAKALAGSGRLGEAVLEFQQFDNQPGCPTWLHTAFLGTIHTISKHHDEAIAYNLKAIALNPVPILYLDLANRLARYKKDPQRARDAMGEADKSVIPEISKPSRLRCLGIIAYLEGNMEEAQRALEESQSTSNSPFTSSLSAIRCSFGASRKCFSPDCARAFRSSDINWSNSVAVSFGLWLLLNRCWPAMVWNRPM